MELRFESSMLWLANLARRLSGSTPEYVMLPKGGGAGLVEWEDACRADGKRRFEPCYQPLYFAEVAQR